MNHIVKFVCIIMLVLGLAACGKYGPLYLSDSYVKSHASKQQPTAPSNNIQPIPRGPT